MIIDGSAKYNDAAHTSITANVSETEAKEFTPTSEEWDALVSGTYGPVADFDGMPDAALNVRMERDRRLAACDWTQAPDAPVDQAAWAAYRQALRDVPQQAGFPEDVVWPEKPL